MVEIDIFFPERDDVGTVIGQTLKRDSIHTPQEALIEIYRQLRPGDPPTLDTATALFEECSSTRRSTTSRAWAG